VPDLPAWEIVLRLGLAGLLGGAIGAERELRERGAGLRTNLLVAVGAALFTIVGAYGFSDFHPSQASGVGIDPTRVAAQIVSGIGFLGAGAILRQGLTVRGLTTAATLWVVAAIGMAAGAGAYGAAVVTTLLVLIGLWPLRALASRLGTRGGPAAARRVEVELTAGASPVGALAAIEQRGARVRSFERTADGDRNALVLQLDLPRGLSRDTVVAALAGADGVAGAQWV
jgi:putative Mg2+ transporter-C (MgtC) family protein